MKKHYRIALAPLGLKPPAQSEVAEIHKRRRERGQIVGNSFWQQIIRSSNRSRRRSLMKGVFLSANEFCRRRRISRERLLREVRRLDVFSVTIEHKSVYPAILADRTYNRQRVSKMCRRLGPFVDGMSKLSFLESRKAPLMGETPMRAVRRGELFNRALILAEGTAEEWLPPELRRRYGSEDEGENRD